MITAQNWSDVEQIAQGARSGSPRTVSAEAVVDTGATGLYLRTSLIATLGLRQTGEKLTRTLSNRTEKRRLFSPVELEIQGRNCQIPVIELPDELPNLVGQIPLEMLDWVVDLASRKLIGNPEHGGQPMFEDYGVDLILGGPRAP